MVIEALPVTINVPDTHFMLVKNFKHIYYFIGLLFIFFQHKAFAITDTAVIAHTHNLIKHGDFPKIEKHLNGITRRVQKTAEKTLRRMRKAELKLFRKIQKNDSAYFKQVQISDSIYRQQLLQLQNLPSKAAVLTAYFPSLDSLVTGLDFYKKTGIGLSGDQLNSIQSLSGDIGKLQQQIKAAGDVQAFLTARKNLLKQYLNNHTLSKEWERVHKELYYYQQQVSVYKELLKQPDKAAAKMIAVLREQPAFRQFMANNSQLAQLFRLPGQTAASSATPVAGLQTRAGVSQLLQQQLPAQGMADPGAYFQQQISSAQSEMNLWKEKLNQLGGGSSDLEMPDFKPNQQKTKTFLQRIEWGLNIQSHRPNGLFPVTSELAIMLGYKLNDKSAIGIGTAYKIGWGKSFNNIQITHQGIGLRSFVDIKLKGSFWITGGYELNHQQEFSRIDELKDLNAWQRSGLIGLSKKYSIGKKKGNLQLLWDFLSYEQVPRTQALKFRIGYIF